MQNTDSLDVLVVGGGLAGCSAAVYAARQGRSVKLIEATRNIGGRVRSLYAKDAEMWVDNGQHVLSNGYNETFSLLKILNTHHLIEKQPRLQISYQFKENPKKQVTLKAYRLPAPFHLLVPLMTQMPLRNADKLWLLRWGITSKRIKDSELIRMSVADWLACAGKRSFRLEEIFWLPLCLATLNGNLENSSALLMSRVLDQAFLASSSLSGLGIPAARLDQIFRDGFEDFFKQHSIDVITGNPARALNVLNNQAISVTLRDSETIFASNIIFATPPPTTAKLLGNYLKLNVASWKYSPIVTIYFRLARPLVGEFPVALPHSPLQWIFELPQNAFPDAGHGYAFVVSGATELAAQADNEIRELAIAECRNYCTPQPDHLDFLSWKIIREKKATFLQTHEAEIQRPNTETAINGLYLAGDWTNTGLPATIESAILSGKKA
ncbi:MAG: hydroxysqualene dehydroxylase HpnE, partial [Calditrichota bacterium]